MHFCEKCSETRFTALPNTRERNDSQRAQQPFRSPSQNDSGMTSIRMHLRLAVFSGAGSSPGKDGGADSAGCAMPAFGL